MSIICVSWQTYVSKASSFAYYHKSCYGADIDQRANKTIRDVDVSELSIKAVCSECHRKLKESEVK